MDKRRFCVKKNKTKISRTGSFLFWIILLREWNEFRRKIGWFLRLRLYSIEGIRIFERVNISKNNFSFFFRLKRLLFEKNLDFLKNKDFRDKIFFIFVILVIDGSCLNVKNDQFLNLFLFEENEASNEKILFYIFRINISFLVWTHH